MIVDLVMWLCYVVYCIVVLFIYLVVGEVEWLEYFVVY